MGLTVLAQTAFLAAMLADPGVPAPPAGQALPEPITTRQTLFSIPFRVNPADPASRDVAGVQLYVSGDRGATWSPYSRVEPARGSFLFRAGGDGEYWFLLRTLDRSGRLRPQGPARPGMRVVVDTSPPQMRLDAGQGDAGQVTTRWEITDPNLNPESLKIQYRTGPYEPWQTVAIDRQSNRASGPVQTGEVSWWPQAAFDRLEIRGEVADSAGNTAVSHAQVRDRAGFPAGVGPSLAGPAGLPTPRLTGPQNSPREPAEPVPPDGPVAIQIHPAYANRYVPQGASGGNADPVPPGERLRMVNSLRFELDYDLPPAGPSQSAQVELWGTRDGGRTWQSFGVDEDRQSPFRVQVREEGIYGFRLAARDGSGRPDEPPSGGSPAELWVGVDVTPPKVTAFSAEPQSGPRAGQLGIRWEADDRMLAPRPVAISFGTGRDGPWSPIASGLENSGYYTWRPGSRVPGRVFLRFEVRDEAGNVAISVTPEPLLLSPPRPAPRIREVRPADEHAQSDGIR